MLLRVGTLTKKKFQFVLPPLTSPFHEKLGLVAVMVWSRAGSGHLSVWAHREVALRVARA